MSSVPGDLHHIDSADIARLFGTPGGRDAIVIEITVPGVEETGLFWMYDAEAFAFIRQLTDVLFDVDPPRSGVGSPEAQHGL